MSVHIVSVLNNSWIPGLFVCLFVCHRDWPCVCVCVRACARARSSSTVAVAVGNSILAILRTTDLAILRGFIERAQYRHWSTH